jgi:hypothetical protein
MSVANPLWGAPRIHGELLKLGIGIGQTTVAKYMVRKRRPPSQGWKTFLRNHAHGIASIDLFVVPTISFRLLYALLVLRHSRRELLWLGVTARGLGAPRWPRHATDPSSNRWSSTGAHFCPRIALYDPPRHRKKLKAAGLDLRATQALIALKTVRVVDIDLGGRATKRSVTRSCVRGQVMKDTPPTLASGVQGRALERPVHAKRQSDEAFN